MDFLSAILNYAAFASRSKCLKKFYQKCLFLNFGSNVGSISINGNGMALADVGYGIATVEDFVLDDGIDGFLDDAGAEATTLPSSSTVFEEDSDR